MRISIIIVIAVVLCGCPQVKQAPAGTGTSSKPGTGSTVPAKKLAVVFSATESEPWVNEVAALVGSNLGIDPWGNYTATGHLDVYGPYQGTLEEQKLDVTFIMTNLISIPGLEGQEAVAGEVLGWLAGFGADVIWLDGDVAQFQIGRQLDKSQSRVFTGVVLHKDFYYDEGEKITGVHKWHSVSAVFAEIWSEAVDAKTYALVIDDSPYSIANMRRILNVKGFLPPDMEFVVMPTVHSWTELAGVIDTAGDSADAMIICGMGGEGSSTDLLENTCPVDILVNIKIPVVALGPTRMDHTGLKSLKIKTAVHVDEALSRISKIVTGVDPRSLKVETPEDMSLFYMETETDETPVDPPG